MLIAVKEKWLEKYLEKYGKVVSEHERLAKSEEDAEKEQAPAGGASSSADELADLRRQVQELHAKLDTLIARQ